MIINKNKVITIPKGLRDSDNSFICPCPVCVEKMYDEKNERAQIEQAKNIISNIFETSSLNVNDLQINVAYADEIPMKPRHSTRSELKSAQSGIKMIASFTAQFNKKYRHPLICKLNQLAEDLQIDLDDYNTMVEYGDLIESRLWKFESIAKDIEELRIILLEIKAENFLEIERVQALIAKISEIGKENKAQLKKLFIKALKIPEFEPHCTAEDFRLTYY